MHETLGTANSSDTADGVPRVTCRFGKVVCNIILYRFSVTLMSLHSLPIACDRRTIPGPCGAVNVYFRTVIITTFFS